MEESGTERFALKEAGVQILLLPFQRTLDDAGLTSLVLGLAEDPIHDVTDSAFFVRGRKEDDDLARGIARGFPPF